MAAEGEEQDFTPRPPEKAPGPVWRGDSAEPLPWRGAEEVEPFFRPAPMSWFEQQFAHTSLPLLVAFGVCCGLFALPIGLAGVVACRHPRARRNAVIVLVVSILWFGFAVWLNVLDLLTRP